MNQTESNERPSNPQSFKQYLIWHRLDFTLWILRFLIVIFFLNYLIPIFGSDSNQLYKKILLAQLAVSFLRLYQRLPLFQATRDYLLLALKEDSSHYIAYCAIFFNNSPLFIILLPIVLFAFLHFTSHLQVLLNLFCANSLWTLHLLVSIAEINSRNILRAVSLIEILLMPITVLLTLSGKMSILTPIVYYNFLVYRYTSRRNPYTRNMFHELRVVFERFALNPSTPTFIRVSIKATINFVTRLKPRYPSA